jgi:hypothetical protein
VADLPAEIARRQDRMARIEEAMAALEHEAREARAAELREQEERHEQNAANLDLPPKARKLAATLASRRKEAIEELDPDGQTKRDDDDDEGGSDASLPTNQVPHQTDGTPKDSAQRNFTDPDSRIMVRDGDHVVQAYNAQAVVDHAHQIVVAVGVGNQAPDCEYLQPMLDRVDANLEAAGISRPQGTPFDADTGYFSEENVEAAEERGFDPHIPPERLRRKRPELQPRPSAEPAASSGPPGQGDAASSGAAPPGEPTAKEKMRAKLKTEEGARIYGLRKTTPEPVFGQILEVRGFRRFLWRGLRKVRAEWDLVTATHNLLKLWRSEVELPSLA